MATIPERLDRISFDIRRSGEARPTAEERAALVAFQWGHITREELDKKIGTARASQLLKK